MACIYSAPVALISVELGIYRSLVVIMGGLSGVRAGVFSIWGGRVYTYYSWLIYLLK